MANPSRECVLAWPVDMHFRCRASEDKHPQISRSAPCRKQGRGNQEIELPSPRCALTQPGHALLVPSPSAKSLPKPKQFLCPFLQNTGPKTGNLFLDQKS